LLSGSGGHPWPHSPPQAIHGLLSATPGPCAASAIYWCRFCGFAIKSREAAFFIGNRDDWWRLSGVLITRRISWSD
jgi:hypothetical protein